MAKATKVLHWPSTPVISSRRNLESLRDKLSSLEMEDTAVPELSRFLTVRSCGHIEFCLEQAILDSFEPRMETAVMNFLRSSFFKGRNPKPDRIEKLLSSFSTEWGEQISQFFAKDDEFYRRELEFLVDRRNKIAHGQSEGIGRAKAIQLCTCSLEITSELIRILQPANFGNNRVEL